MLIHATSPTRLVVALLATLCATPAAAQSDDEARARSRAHFVEGVEHLQAERHEDAIRELEAARSLYPTASIHFNLGLSYRAVGRLGDAIAAMEHFLRASGDTVTPERRDEVERTLRTLRASIGRLRIEVSPGTARIVLDGETVGHGRAELGVDPGTHQLVVRAEGHVEATEQIEIEPGSDRAVRLQLDAVETAGRLRLDVTPDETTVTIDGRLRGIGDMTLELGAGEHALTLEADGARREHALEIVTGEELSLSLSVDGGDDLTWLWVTLAILVIGGGAAAVTYVVLNPSDQAPITPDLGLVTTALRFP